MSTSKYAALSLSILLAFVPNAHAGAMTGGATEITQILNNFELVAQVQQQVKAVNELVTSNLTQYQQLQAQLQAGMKIGGVNLGDVMKVKSDLEGYQSALRSLGGDLPQLQNVFDIRLTEARLQNISLQDYVVREGQRIAQGNAQAKARVNREIAQVDQVKRDVALVRDLGDKIPSTAGVHSATQLLNSQMNVMLQQMTRLVSLTSEAQGSDKAAAQAKEAADRQDGLVLRESLRTMHDTQKQREQAQIEAGRR